ncbi:MAG: hypothetical protein D6790_10735 [Caldilineae bacterium]|nr:MAG: hypothetical protein D6790_10735 [Caldilineae bacterium]
MHTFVNHTGSRAGRRYAVWLQQDLFGQWTLVRFYGSARREPVLRSQVVRSRKEGERLMRQIVRLRLRHGYVEIGDVRK